MRNGDVDEAQLAGYRSHVFRASILGLCRVRRAEVALNGLCLAMSAECASR